jgi:RNA polymerase sigma factor (sigma-70 family)
LGDKKMTKDYRITVKVRNNRILKAIEDVGGNIGAKWCEANGLGYMRVNAFIQLKSGPLNANGDLFPDALRLCEVLGKLPEELWSNEQLYPLERNFSEMEMDYSQVVAMLPAEQQSYLPDYSHLEQEQAKKLIGRALSTLTDRERKLIQMRFEGDLPLENCAKYFDVTRERARQIEAKALRKLRRAPCVGMLVDLMDFSEADRNRYKQATADYLEHKKDY